MYGSADDVTCTPHASAVAALFLVEDLFFSRISLISGLGALQPLVLVLYLVSECRKSVLMAGDGSEVVICTQARHLRRRASRATTGGRNSQKSRIKSVADP